MSRMSRDLAHWERLWHGGHCTREQFREAAQELSADESWIVLVIGPEPEEIEERQDGRDAA